MTLVIVVPCYNEEKVLMETTKRLGDLMQKMITNKVISEDSRILYVNDGSKDATWDIITLLSQTNTCVCGVNLSRNVGHQNALMAGLEVALDMGDVFVTIDADLQDDINVIPEMISKYNKGNDIVYGVRKERKTDTFFKRNTALAFYRLMDFWGVKTVYNHADYRLMSKRAVCHLFEYEERNLFLRGIVPLIGYQTATVYYNRDKRFAGESKYPLGKMLNFAIDGITSFSVKPLRLIFLLGILFVLVALCIVIYVLLSVAAGNNYPGWASIMLSIWFVGGCILISLGIVGEYIGKIYTEVKRRPRYHIAHKIGCQG